MPVLIVESMNPKSKGTVYEVDSEKLTCSCPAFVMGMTRPCKHMKSVLSEGVLSKVVQTGQSTDLAKSKPRKGVSMPGLYTVGHSNHTVAQLVDNLLAPNEITTIIDVRSTPYSRYNPQFNRQDFAGALYKNKIRYLYGGKTLGGSNGMSIEHPRFKEDIQKVLDLSADESVAMMCSEGKPQECHRAYKLSAYMIENKLDDCIQHITMQGLVDAEMLQLKMPQSWLWVELGGEFDWNFKGTYKEE